MEMNQKKKEQLRLLQRNLASIRRIAGWTAEQFGEKIGFTKQTISNLENFKTPMNFSQYIAIRTILDYEIETKRNKDILQKILFILIDKREEFDDEEEYSKVKKAIEAVSVLAGMSFEDKGLATTFNEFVTPILPPAIIRLLGDKIGNGATSAYWLKNLLRDEDNSNYHKER